MKKISFLIFLIISGISFAYADKDDMAKIEKRIQEVQEYKMKYLAQEMELSDVQKKKFFEVYGEMTKAKMQCFKLAKQYERKIKHEKAASEHDYQLATEEMDKANAEWSETEQRYNEKFSEFLTPKQIYKMREAEANFRAKWDEMKHNRKRDHKDKK